jgi:cell wall-associated NlpC family hydrolase
MTVIPAWVGTYIGTPYAEDDAPPGAHCLGLVRRVFADRLGLALPADDGIGAHELMAVAKSLQRHSAAWVPVANGRRPFDVVLMGARDGSRAPVHVGVMVSPHHLLHVEEGLPAAVAAANHKLLAGRILATYRHEALT